MKKLKLKAFFTIFIILNIFACVLLFIYNYQNYKTEKNKIVDSLRNSSIMIKRHGSNIPMRFVDSKVYTVILSKDKKIIDIINNSNIETIDVEIVKFASKIIKSDNKYFIGNLYRDKYSYKAFDNYMVIVDNSSTNHKLKGIFKSAVLMLIIIEFIVYYIAFVLSKWIIKPVEESFNKQKQFIEDASHELKTPLAVIMANADALEKNKNEKKYLNNIQSESERMSKLVTNLLDLSKIENSKLVLEDVNLSKIIEKSILTLESLMFEKNIELKYNLQEDIIFKSNGEEMKQLISILLDNAIKHSIDDGKIVVNLNVVKSNIILEVINKGEGIKKGEEEKIFERFYRVDESRNRNDNRYGLGLAIAKSIVEKYGGQISASSEKKLTTLKVIFNK